VGDVEGAVPPRNPPSDPRPPSCRSRHPIGIRRPPVFRGFTQSHAEREGDRRGGHLPEDGGFPSRRSFGGSARPGDGIVGGRKSPREREPARFRPPFRTEGGEGAADGRLVGWVFARKANASSRTSPAPRGGGAVLFGVLRDRAPRAIAGATRRGGRVVNDPSAGSPTETLLRLLLPLVKKI
jgi:hypothetical protein